MELIKTPVTHYKIRFSDCDMLGHLNNSRYLDYLMNAREDHLKDAYHFDIKEYYKNGLAWVIRNHQIEYLRPAHYDEMVSISSTLLQVNEESLQVEIIMMNQQQNQLKAIMWTTSIPVNMKTGKREKHADDFLKWAVSLVNNETIISEKFYDRVKTITEKLKYQTGC